MLKILPIVIIIGVKEALTNFAQNVGKNLTIIVEIRNILETCFGNTQILRMFPRLQKSGNVKLDYHESNIAVLDDHNNSLEEKVDDHKMLAYCLS